MDITPFEIYLIMQADEVISLATFFFIGCGMAVCVSVPSYLAAKNDGAAVALTLRKIIITFLATFVAAAVIGTVTPSTKTLIAMYGIPAAIEAADTAGLDETARKSVRAVNKLLDAYLEEETDD